MPRGHGGKTLGFGIGAEHPKLHLAVAHDVRIGREPASVAVEQVIHHEPAVVAHEVDNAKLDAELLRHRPRIFNVLDPRAIAGQTVLIDPVLHVGADHLAALLLEEERGDAAVDAARHGDEDFFHGRPNTSVPMRHLSTERHGPDLYID